jgi:hypothetical protein
MQPTLRVGSAIGRLGLHAYSAASLTVHTVPLSCVSSHVPFIHSISPHRIPALHLRLYHYPYPPKSFFNIPNFPGHLGFVRLLITCIHMRRVVCSLSPCLLPSSG